MLRKSLGDGNVAAIAMRASTILHHKDSEYAREREHCRNFYGIDLMQRPTVQRSIKIKVFAGAKMLSFGIAEKEKCSTFALGKWGSWWRSSGGNSSVGRAQPCQGWGREFESRFPLKGIGG